ncbi:MULTISPECIES: AlpA family phage regulatory protein [Sinorhizobium]|uniref:AlpA family phage regulatory protein n=1 Tax=Sinorhizobium mexicanum TaxID=375549 RepID=A0A859QEU5_9HYPH|nr:AlpA family phage regulatory protein [Sinorhizobium mexicanum]QLL63462.1 AlpA family phage regulatory protein [Sinorhizobium mexicanum]
MLPFAPKVRCKLSNKLPETGFVRLKSIIGPTGPIPISKSSWWKGIREGRFPPPQKLGPRTSVWPVESIRDLIEKHTVK